MVQTGAGGMARPEWGALPHDIIPAVDETYDLGAANKRWAYLFAVIAVLTSIVIGGVVNISTIDSWLFINASTMINESLNVSDDVFIDGNLTALGNTINFANANVTASYYIGDGSLLTGIQHGALIFFLHNETSSDMLNSNTLEYEFNDTGLSTISSTITSTDQQIKNFTTDSGIPGLQIIPDGIAHVHFHAKKASGTKTVKIYYEYYIVFADNSTSLVATGEASDALTGSSVSYNIHSSHNETLLNSTDRLQIRLIAELTGVGSNPVIEIYIEGLTASRFELPGPVASTANFIPYTGAIRNVSLGNYNITAAYYFGNGSQLTDLTFTETDPYWSGNQSSYFNTTDILGFNYYNSSDFDITDYFTSATILGFSYYNSSVFSIADYYSSSDIDSFNYWNNTYATFNKTYADTLYYAITNPSTFWNSTFATFNKTYADTLYATISEPLWSGNETNVAFKNEANVFTAGQNLTGQNITAIDCIIFDSGGKICSGV